MGKSKYYWYYSVKTMIQKSASIKKEESLQAYIFQKAIEDALKETQRLPNGDYRVKAIEEILIYQRMDYQRAATELHFDRNTIQKWTTSFVNLVGKKAGY